MEDELDESVRPAIHTLQDHIATRGWTYEYDVVNARPGLVAGVATLLVAHAVEVSASDPDSWQSPKVNLALAMATDIMLWEMGFTVQEPAVPDA